MGARGKQSATSLNVVRPEGVSALSRPNAPDELTDEQAHEWLAIVNRMPAEWFTRETHPLLAQYCRHVVTSRRIGQMLDNLLEGDQVDGWLEDFDRLTRMQEREGRAMTALARSMRLTQQSSYSKEKKRGSAVKKPWN